MTETPVVTIQCLVYNHEPYLRQCLDGFVMQKTNFPYEAIVHDDCSTDQSAAIIREYAERYPDIIKPIYESENQYSKKDGRLIEIINKHTRGRYVAFCEGDDYWTDPYKLQKQVTYLEQHTEIGLCYTDFDIKDENNKHLYRSILKNKQHSNDRFLIEEWILKTPYIGPMTWMVKKNLWQSIPNVLFIDGTFHYFTFFLANSKIAYLNATTAVYRIIPESASHSKDLIKVYNYYKLLHEEQLALTELYIPKLNKAKLQEAINKQYYTKRYNLILCMEDREEQKKADLIFKKGNVSKRHLVSLFAKNKFTRHMFKIIYKHVLQSRYGWK